MSRFVLYWLVFYTCARMCVYVYVCCGIFPLILLFCVTLCWPEHNDWTQYTDRGISNSSLWLPAYTIMPAVASTDLLKDNDLWFR